MAKKVRVENEYMGYKKEDNWQFNEWKTTLKYGNKQMTVPFKMGIGLSGEPEVRDVLSSLISDRACVLYSRDFEDFCADLGYDPDSRKAEKIYNDIKKQSAKLEKFLGDDLDKIAKELEE